MTLYPHRLEFVVLPFALRSRVPGVAAAFNRTPHTTTPRFI